LNLPEGTFSVIAAFLTEIGLPVEIGEILGDTFLPGIHAAYGILQIDLARLQWPGDILHEAGHLAILTPEQRHDTQGNVGDDGGDEMGAIAWSYAAAMHLHLDPEVVFHAGGYQGGSEAILANFAAGRYMGVPILAWRGLCMTASYPLMTRWLRA
jgi:hypothetical protein